MRHDRMTPVTLADLPNDRVVAVFDDREIRLIRLPIDQRTRYCGNPERQEHEPYLAVGDIVHSGPKAKRPPNPGMAVGSIAFTCLSWCIDCRDSGQTPGKRRRACPYGCTGTINAGFEERLPPGHTQGNPGGGVACRRLRGGGRRPGGAR